MKHNRKSLRRLILGMSIEDSQSKFDTPEARRALLLAHQRHNQGVYHELQVAQRQRDKMTPDRKCHIARFAKPTVRGFQAYTKGQPDDYIVRELWETAAAAASESGDAVTSAHASPRAVTISPKVCREQEAFRTKRKIVLDTLTMALEGMKEQVSDELAERAESGTVATGQQQKPIVDRLIAEVNEGKEKGYRSMSSSSHLLIPVEMTARLYARKDQEIASAFKDPLLNFPAREGDISFSLWVAGGLVADADLIKAYPFQIARYAVGDEETSANRLPTASVEVYFSPDLYQMQRAVGASGIASLRQFVGRIMQKQHEPTPASTSELLNASSAERNSFQTLKDEVIQIPWVHKTKMKISTKTGVVFSEEDSAESATSVAKKEAVAHVWKAWGHLIKDLHIHGDLDFLYVSINRRQEVRDNDDYIAEVRQVETEKEATKAVATTVGPATSLRTTRNAFALAVKQDNKRRKNIFVPMAADFTVVECLLERCGLPHNMVIDDLTVALQELQTQTLEMLRLSVVDELEELKDVDTSEAVPVLYAPKIVVSHAGVIENGTHSYQRIRIRGSSLAHVETLVEALKEADYFTDRSGTVVAQDSSSLLPLPPNLSFQATHSHSASSMRRVSRRLLGHRAGAAFSERDEGGRFKPYQESQEFDFLNVSEDERQFWQEHYYRLSEVKLVFHDRVDPQDVFSDDVVHSARLTQQVALVQSAIHSDHDTAEEGGGSTSSSKGSKRKRGAKRGKQNKETAANRHGNLAPDAMFQLMCMDMEAEALQFDLAPGDCRGYAYDIKLRKVTARDAPLVRPAMLSLETKGFINYFGSSRFATYTKMNMHPGLHLLKGEFRAAAYIIVQQFYLDAAVTAERMRTGSAFPSVLNMKGAGVHLPDFAKNHGRRSVAEHGTALQKVLNNAIQASMLFQEDNDDLAGGHSSGSVPSLDVGSSPLSALDLTDPCAEAFLKVIGPRACHMLIREFLSFVWNDICNQRLQRYGTFSILPGDLVYNTASGAAGHHEVTRVTRRDVEQQRYNPHDVLLPIPGAGVELPDNHTTDLYVVALKRLGILFDPEQRQWNLFYPTDFQHQPDGAREASAPFRMLTPTFSLMEEELRSTTPSADRLGGMGRDSLAEGEGGGDDGELSEAAGAETGHIRPDLRRQGGNAIGLYVTGGYRAPLYRPPVQSWTLRRGVVGDPYQRWGASLVDSREPLESGGDGVVARVTASAAGQATRHHQEPLFLQPNPVQVRRRERAAADSASGADEAPTSGSRRRRRSGALPVPEGAARRRSFYRTGLSRAGRTLPHPATPYWLPQRNDSCLELSVTLPPSVYPQSMLRELLKSDVFTPDVVDIDRPLIDSRSRSFESLTSDQQATYRRLLAKRRKQAFQTPPRAISLALLHQQIFRSGGARFSLIPTLRSYDSVSTK